MTKKCPPKHMRMMSSKTKKTTYKKNRIQYTYNNKTKKET